MTVLDNDLNGRLRASSSRGLGRLTRSKNRRGQLALIMRCQVEVLDGETGRFRNDLRDN